MAYVTLAQIRALPNLSDAAKFTDAEITAATTWFETVFEDYTGVAWETRTVTAERHDGTGTSTLQLDFSYPRSVTAVSVYSDATTSTAFTAAELADLRISLAGEVQRVSLGTFAFGHGNITVSYTHAKTTTPPADVVEAAKVAIRAHLIDDYQANRQFAVSTEAGIVRTSQPGPDRPFGLPDVDATANRRREFVYGIA